MKLTVIGTGSSGNCYMLENKYGAILLDAGLPIAKIRNAVQDWSKIGACFVTHEHGDHAKAVHDLCKRGIVCYMSPGTKKAIMEKRTGPVFWGNNMETIRASDLVLMDTGFTIMPFNVRHDASEPLGYMLKDQETKKILVFATDMVGLCNRFSNVSYWLIECNYCLDLLVKQRQAGAITDQLFVRIAGSHMDLDALAEYLVKNDLSKTELIVLCHLSDTRSDEGRMIKTIRAQTGCTTIAAANGLSIDLETVQP